MRLSILILLTALLVTRRNIDHVPEKDSARASELPLMSEISVLTIHVSDTMVHDSVFHFLSDILGLPVEYYPVKWHDRKWAGLYAGNMFLEPCGPYDNFRYARNNFKATFYGLNCGTGREISSLEQDLTARNIDFIRDGSIEITDPSITEKQMYFSISWSKSSSLKESKDQRVKDSLKVLLANTSQNFAGIEAIREVWIGYTGEHYDSKWTDLVKPEIISENGVWKISRDQSIRFRKNDKTEVMAIVFKVSSLKRAKRFLLESRLLGESGKDLIEIDPEKAFGLRIYFSE